MKEKNERPVQESHRPKQGETKRESYHSLDIPPIDRRVLDYIEENPDSTRAEIEKGTGLRQGTVSGAVNRLVYNKGVVIVSGSRVDPDSKKTVETVRKFEHTVSVSAV